MMSIGLRIMRGEPRVGDVWNEEGKLQVEAESSVMLNIKM